MRKNKFAKVGKYFDWVFVSFGFWLICGLYVDGWAHVHLASTRETFFTPWHGILYSGFFAIFLLLTFTAWKNHKKGFAWRHSLPREYILSMAGALIFLLAGLGDMGWHLVWGIEVGVDALLSPTHMLLAFAGAMMASGPLHAIWYRNTKEEKLHSVPVVVSFILLFCTLTFMTQFLHPYYVPWMASGYRTTIDVYRGVGIADNIIYTGLFMGLFLSALRYFKFPFGSFIVILGIDALGMAFLKGEHRFIFSALVAGLFVDLLYLYARPYFDQVHTVRIFGFFVPVIIFSCYVFTILVTEGTWWSVHLSAGSIFICGIVGFLLTYLVVPPGDHIYPKHLKS